MSLRVCETIHKVVMACETIHKVYKFVKYCTKYVKDCEVVHKVASYNYIAIL